jgi:hypothetical protein
MLPIRTKRYIRLRGDLATYLDLMELMNLQTRTCFPSVPRLAEMDGVDVTTIRRRLRRLEAKGVVVTTLRKYAYRSNHTSIYFLPILDDDFFLSHPMPVVGGKNAPVKQLPKIEKQTKTSRAIARRERFSERVSPQRPVPDAEVYASEQRGRELRREHWQKVRGPHRNWREWRGGREDEIARLQARACVGMAPTPTEYDPVAADAYWKRERERELSPLERARRHDGGINGK